MTTATHAPLIKIRFGVDFTEEAFVIDASQRADESEGNYVHRLSSTGRALADSLILNDRLLDRQADGILQTKITLEVGGFSESYGVTRLTPRSHEPITVRRLFVQAMHEGVIKLCASYREHLKEARADAGN